MADSNSCFGCIHYPGDCEKCGDEGYVVYCENGKIMFVRSMESGCGYYMPRVRKNEPVDLSIITTHAGVRS
jgi:hypothetical protein